MGGRGALGGNIFSKAEDLIRGMNKNNAFKNNISSYQPHISAYMTVPNYEKIASTLDQFKDKYTKNEWKGIAKYLNDMGILSPNKGIIGLMIEESILKGKSAINLFVKKGSR
jgi:hypothetical protein